MFFVHIGFIMLVTIGTTKLRIIGRIGVTIGTIAPFALVRSAVNREIQFIVIKSGWFPCINVMTGFTICRKISRCMCRTCGTVVIILMTTVTI